MGVELGQFDPGWWFLKIAERIGLVWDLKQPEDVGEREGLRRIESSVGAIPRREERALVESV